MPFLGPPSSGVLLGTTTMAAGAASSATVSFPDGYDQLSLRGWVAGYSGAGIVALQFGVGGGAILTTAVYQHMNMPFPTATATAFAVSAATATTNQVNLAGTANTVARFFTVDIENYPISWHGVTWTTQDDGTAVGTFPAAWVGRGGLLSGSASRITSVRLTNSAGVNLLAGTEFAVYGHTIG